MKKKDLLWSLLAIVMVAMLSVGMSSCGDDPEPPKLSVNGTSAIIEANGVSNGNLIVTAENTDWYVNVTQGNDWLSAYKNGNTISFSAKENSETNDRTGTVVVTATENSQLSYTINVTQKGVSPFITVNGSTNGEKTFEGLFGTGKSGIDHKYTFKVHSNIEWTLSADDESWLNISPKKGKGEVDLAIYPLSENPHDKTRTAHLTISGSGIEVPITINQLNGKPVCYVIPANEVALYDRFCWEYTATSNANNFQYVLLSEREFNRLSDNELIEEIKKEDVKKYDDGWLSMFGYDSHDNRITSNSVYYFVSLASDKDGKYGELQKIKLTTPKYLDANQDAYVSFSNFENNSYQFQFDAKKEGFCDTYHVIYGIYDEKLNSAVYAFEINYYLKNNKKKHWLAKNDYYEWEILENYPNNHTFSYTSYLMSYFPVCFGYGWGIFKNGDLSSDLLGFQVDTSSSSAPQMRVSRTNDDAPKNVVIKRSDVLKRAKSLSKK